LSPGGKRRNTGAAVVRRLPRICARNIEAENLALIDGGADEDGSCGIHGNCGRPFVIYEKAA